MNVSDDSILLNDSLYCPNYTTWDNLFLEHFSYWTEGVIQTICAILGILGNALAVFILTRKSMRNVFNLLLVTLAVFDTTYLFGSILESFRKHFSLASQTHLELFPSLLYPGTQIAIAGSIFMTVAIALERYLAIHYPITYNQAMNEANALPKRVTKYICSVLFLAILFSFTRFLEAKVTYNDSGVPILDATSVRTHPLYIQYFNWSRLLVLGIIPFSLLVFFNAKIYQDIQARRSRRYKPEIFHLRSAKSNTVIESNANKDTSKTEKVREKHVNETRSKKEDNLAIIFMVFILVFLICHLPRLILNVHELLTIDGYMKCQESGHEGFSLISMLTISISHLLLVINSSTNMIIYCALSSKFREECSNIYTQIYRKCT